MVMIEKKVQDSGLETLAADLLDFRLSQITGGDDLPNQCRRYIQAYNVVKDFLPETRLSGYDRRYSMLVEEHRRSD